MENVFFLLFFFLTFITLWANSADDKLMVFFLNFSEKIGFDISCKLFPEETICIKCWSLFPGKNIAKTYPYSFDPLKPHFYIVKLVFAGYTLFFLFLLKNIDCALEPPRRGGSNEYPLSMFWAEIWKISEFFIWKFSVFGGKVFSIFE